jgi:hypothetical protein
MTLKTYKASDRRVYNGALCTDMKNEIDHESKLMKILRKIEPSASCTFFPLEYSYMVFVNHRMVTGIFHECKQEAIIEAIENLRGER